MKPGSIIFFSPTRRPRHCRSCCASTAFLLQDSALPCGPSPQVLCGAPDVHLRQDTLLRRQRAGHVDRSSGDAAAGPALHRPADDLPPVRRRQVNKNRPAISFSHRRFVAGLTVELRVFRRLYEGISDFYNRSSGIWEQVWGEHMHSGFYGADGKTLPSWLRHRLCLVFTLPSRLR